MTFDMKKAEDLLYHASEFVVSSVPGQTGSGVDHSKHRDFKAMIEICSRTFPEALAEIRRLETQIREMEETR